MKKYHILFFEDKTSNISTGKNYIASNPAMAYLDFENEYPNAIILQISSEEMFSLKY